jgi:hypothetical protein
VVCEIIRQDETLELLVADFKDGEHRLPAATVPATVTDDADLAFVDLHGSSSLGADRADKAGKAVDRG